VENSPAELLDFTAFLTAYAAQSGLAQPKVATENLWVPSRGGRWSEAPSAALVSLAKAARPYALDGSTEATDEEGGLRAATEIWVGTDEVSDILMLNGNNNATEEAVGSAVYDLKHLLPGLPTGKLCFQELLAVERALDAGADLEDTNELRLEKRRRDKNALASTDGGPASGAAPAPSSRMAKTTGTSFDDSRARAEEFKRLDLTGEGRLTFLTMKSALEIRGESVPDSGIRQWLRDNDSGSKGYVDIDDFMQASRTPEAALVNAEGPLGAPRAAPGADAQRREVLKRAFRRYDVDGDGYISVDDLRIAFEQQGRATSETELVQWVRKRDTIGAGAVNFEDFAKKYVSK
jgi:Ca2+-binding EF-hand superfamily protein